MRVIADDDTAGLSPAGTVSAAIFALISDIPHVEVGRRNTSLVQVRRNPDDGPSEQAVEALRQQVEDMRAAIIETRRIRQSKRNWRLGLMILVLVVALALWRYWYHRYR